MKIAEFTLSAENCHIIDSYKVTKTSDMIAFCKEVLPDRFLKTRSIKSYVREWKAHNFLYAIHFQVSHTKDCDLNLNENIFLRIGYFFISLLYFPKNNHQ